MAKTKTSELIGWALNWAVATALGRAPQLDMESHGLIWRGWWLSLGGEYERMPDYQGGWEFGGPIIQREHIGLISPMNKLTLFWTADIGFESRFTQFDHDPLIAAMRCYVASKLGDEVDVPEELT